VPAPAGLFKNPVGRRNLLFGLTLLTLVLVFIGAVPLGGTLMKAPLAFAIFWLACFILAVLVLVLAFYDLMRVRREHARRIRDLDKELAAAAEEARRLMREMKERGE
jgi:hypothetical protein